MANLSRIFLGLFLLIGTSVSALASDCLPAPAGFDFQKIRVLMNVKKMDYKYYLHIEFPNLAASCWQDSGLSTLTTTFPAGTKIVIRLSSLDDKESNVIDEISTPSLSVVQNSENPEFQKMETSLSSMQGAKITVFHSEQRNFSLLLTENLRLPMDSDYLNTEFLKAAAQP